MGHMSHGRDWKRQVSTDSRRKSDIFINGISSEAALSRCLGPCSRDFLSCSTTDTLTQDDSVPLSIAFDALFRMTSPPSVAPRDVIQAAVEAAVASCMFPVTLMSPTCGQGMLMVSPGFEELTGAPKEVLLASGLRCLDADPLMQDPAEMMRLRTAENTGEEATAMLVMRKLTGEYLNVLAHQRGLVVGKHPDTGEDLWLLIGLYIDVGDTEMDTLGVLEANVASLSCLEEQIHKIVSEHLDVVLADELWAAMPSDTSSEPLQMMLTECSWMQTRNSE
eukprot:CAMPEP_0115268908 /NCGR_PEP_ID=MMETSP0270-20121206/52759_1 /TAXON_ID=71861 /ORGANISM="Scrippsiella trochoidea, Strain CCMP3099" /LENGTH=277 /DNA_ID=CAMNT_0002685117 /DNA_START=1 /DNA_END=834 /DNA_ORIENTATION=+